jgi:hypothetical protein
MSESTSDIDVMLPRELSIVVAGELVVLEKVRMRQVTQLVSLMAPMAYLFTDLGSIRNFDVKSFALNHPQEAISIVSILVKKPQDWVLDLDPEEFIRLGLAVVEVNLDFFIQKVTPSILREMERLQSVFRKVLEETGRLHSNFSSPQGTDTKTS